MSLEIKVAIIAGIFGILGGLISTILGYIFPSLGYMLRRIIEKSSSKDQLEIINQTLDINQKMLDQNIPSKFNFELALIKSLGKTATNHFFDFNRDKNLSNILDKSQKELGEDDRIKPIDPTWFLNFSNMASNMSDETVQELWSNILSKEIKVPGSFSLRTLDAVKNISTEEAVIFEKVACFCIDDTSILISKESIDLSEFDIKYIELVKLQEAGLLSTKIINYRIEYVNNFEMKYISKILKFNRIGVNNNSEKLLKEFRVINLTKIGQELFKLLRLNIDQRYLKNILELNSNEFTIEVIDTKT